MRVLPGQLSLQQLETFYRSHSPVELDRQCRTQVELAAATVQRAAAGEVGVYGVNTGFGKLANTRIPPDQTMQLQRNLILSHCCGVGQALPDSRTSTTMKPGWLCAKSVPGPSPTGVVFAADPLTRT